VVERILGSGQRWYMAFIATADKGARLLRVEDVIRSVLRVATTPLLGLQRSLLGVVMDERKYESNA